MTIRLPLRELIRYSFTLSVAINVFFFIMIYLQDLDLAMGIYRSLISGCMLLSVSAISIILIVVFEKKNFCTQEKNSATIRFVIGCILTILLMLLVQFLRLTAEKHGYLPNDIYESETHYEWRGWQLYTVISAFSIMMYALVHLLHNFILLQHLKTQTELEVSQLRSINAETTNQLLRQQVQPHFLFNALNVLKSLIKKNPQTAETYLLRLSDFLRTSFTQNKKGVATLGEEVKLCRDYLEMQKMRFGDALNYTFDISENALSGILPFFSLQPLAENAIKHNELTDDNPLHIRIKERDGTITVQNNLQRKQSVDNSTGNGLTNLSERYNLLSGRHIKILDDGNFFSVVFKMIAKHENHNH